MRSNRYYIIAMALIIMPILAACRQELCYDHFPTLDVNMHWEQEWERDYGEYHLNSWDANYFESSYDEFRPGIPEWVNMIRYYDGEQYGENFISPDGKQCVVEAGKESSILLYNGDTEYIVISDVASLNDARASATTRTRSGSSMQMLFDVHHEARTTNPPDILYSAYISNVPAISNHEVKHYNVKMQPLVYSYIIMYEFEYGLKHVALARGAIGGMAEAVYLRTGVTSEESAIILFDCDVNSRGCIAKIRSFGAPGFPDVYYGKSGDDEKERKYTLNLELKLTNGNTVSFNYDISDQMKNQPRGGVIRISGVRVEDEDNPPSSSGSGFDVDLSGWGHEEIDLPI